MTTEIAESLACWRCGKLVRVSGSLEHLTGFLENVAPHAASGGTMRPVHSACSTPRCPHGVSNADLCWACNPDKQTSQPKAPHIGPFILYAAPQPALTGASSVSKHADAAVAAPDFGDRMRAKGFPEHPGKKRR